MPSISVTNSKRTPNQQPDPDRERYAKPAASAGLLGLREQSVQATGSNLSGFLHNANFA